MAKAKRDAVFDDDMYAVERILSQFVCPTHVAPPPTSRVKPSSEGGGSGSSSAGSGNRKLTKAEVIELQRLSSERLYAGSSFASVNAEAAAKKAPRKEARIPPAKKLDLRLNQLRADPVAREALRLKAEQDLRNKFKEKMRACGGGIPKNFITINTETERVYSRANLLVSVANGEHKKLRPRSAPLARNGSSTSVLSPPKPPSPPRTGSPERLEDRHPFRPGGAPAEAYLRPGSARRQPLEAWPRSRPQSALTRPTSAVSCAGGGGPFAAAADREVSFVLAPSAASALSTAPVPVLVEGPGAPHKGTRAPPADAPPLA